MQHNAMADMHYKPAPPGNIVARFLLKSVQLHDAWCAHVQMDITSNHWAETGPAMTALKRIIK